MQKQSRRNLLKGAAAATVGVAALAGAEPGAAAQSSATWVKKVVRKGGPPASAQDQKPAPPAGKPPLFNSIVTFGNLVFLAGVGAHFKGTIEEHTKHVLDELEENLKLAGSSMDKVLKVNVYLSDLANYQRMNTVYQGRFGGEPPVRTTVAVVNGVPGDSLVEIDCIAAL
jgi:enamine deaminase RidA (YjgF/YER057c/UK114 family)